MPELIIKNFSQGWCPSDSPINARDGALFHTDGIEFDINGDLSMPDGLRTIGTSYASNAHTIFSKFIGTGHPHYYLALENGAIYRNNTSIKTGGSATRACFVAAYDYVMAFSATKRIRDDGAATADLGQVKASVALTTSLNGVGVLNGTYEYIQLNIFVNGAYQAKSAPNAISTALIASANKISVTAQNPTSPANEVWIFRRGGNLDQFYRVKRLTSSYNTPFDDNLTDEDAQLIGITLSTFALSVNSTDLPDDVLGVEGPINGRLLLCTKNTLYFTEVNSPESYVPGQGIAYSTNVSSGAEVFLWIKKVAENLIAIGTTTNVYSVTGTFITLPDGTLDVYLRPLNVKYPPIDIWVETYNNALVFMSKTGWRVTSLDGSSQSLIDDRVDRIYRGETILNTNGNNAGIPIYLYPLTGPGGAILRYSCAIGQNKLYCRMPAIANNDPTQAFSNICHIYDFGRKAWRTANQVPRIFHAQEDGAIIGFFDSDSKLKLMNFTLSKLDDGTKQSIDVLFPVFNFGAPRHRKDWESLKFKTYTGGDAVTVKASIDDGASFSTIGSLTSASLLEKSIDISTVAVAKSIQLRLTGQIADFKLSDITFQFGVRPEQKLFTKVNRIELPEVDGHKFRPRTWPVIIDTLGSNVTFTPIIDGADGTPSTFNSSYKKTLLHFFKTDVVCENLGYKLSGANLFELYEVKPPEIVQIFPMGKQFDQLGPHEFFRHGKVRRIMLRLYSDFTGNLPYKVYFQDASSETGNIALIASVEDSYEISTTKLEGNIVRLELGPTSSNFYRYYAMIQAARSGRDTEYEWIQI